MGSSLFLDQNLSGNLVFNPDISGEIGYNYSTIKRAASPFTLEVTMATKKQVVESWINGQRSSTPNGSLSTNGDILFSYQLKIGYKQTETIELDDGYEDIKTEQLIVLDYTASGGNFVSSTTSTHVGLAKRYADKIEEAV